MPGPPRDLVADHHHVAGDDAPSRTAAKRILLAIEDAGRPGVPRTLVPGRLHHRTVRTRCRSEYTALG